MILIFLLISAAFAMADELKLTVQTIATDNQVFTLGDLFTGTGYDSLELCRGLQPGKERKVYVSQLNALLKAGKTGHQIVSEFSFVALTRNEGVFPEQKLLELVREKMQRLYPDEKYSITFSDFKNSIPPGKLEIILESEPVLGRQVLRFALIDSSGEKTRISLKTMAGLKRNCPMSIRDITAGEIIENNDLKTEEYCIFSRGDMESFRNFDPAGLVITCSVKDRTFLSEKWFKTPVMVQRGEVVTAVKKIDGIEITGKLEIMENGCHGETVRAKNTQSGKIMNVRVISYNQVQII